MNRTELIAKVAEKSPLTSRALGNALGLFIDAIQEEVKNGGEVLIPGFAKFDSVTKPERSGNNPLNGKPYHSPAKRVPKITAGKAFKGALL
jgi:DNA-binding protein HU-beta